MAVSKGHAALAAARREQKNIRKRKKMRQEITEIAGEGFAYAKGQYDVSQTAWDEYEAGYKEVTGEDYTGERGGWFSKPEGQVRVGERMYSRESFADVGRFKQTLGESPEGLMNYDKIMARYKENVVGEGRLATGEDLGAYLEERATSEISPRTGQRKVPLSVQSRRADASEAARLKGQYGVGVRTGVFGKGSGMGVGRDRVQGIGSRGVLNQPVNQPVQKLDAVSAAFTTPKPILSSSGVDAVSASFTPKVTVGESYGPPNPNKGTSTRSSKLHEELESRYGKDWKNRATNTGMDKYLDKPRLTDPKVGNAWDFQLKNNKKLNEGSYRK